MQMYFFFFVADWVAGDVGARGLGLSRYLGRWEAGTTTKIFGPLAQRPPRYVNLNNKTERDCNFNAFKPGI